MMGWMRETFKKFHGREVALTTIDRYHKYPVMFYRTNLWTHTNRLVWLVDALTPAIRPTYPSFNPLRAKLMAAVHDDTEMIIGDVQFGSKLNMTEKERSNLKQSERHAIKLLAKKYPYCLEGIPYETLLTDAFHCDSADIDAIVVKYVDKMDAYCEAWHELYAGNGIFAHGFAKDILSPVESYRHYFSTTYYGKYSLFNALRGTHIFFSDLPAISIESAVRHGVPYSDGSITTVHSTNPHWGFWKNVTREYGGSTGAAWLTEQKER